MFERIRRNFTREQRTSTSGLTPFGARTLRFSEVLQVRERFANGDVDDVLIVVTYSGETDYGGA